MTAGRSVNRNIVVLTLAQALGAAGPPIVFSLGGLVGQRLSEDPALITLPVSLFNLGLALGTLPAGALVRRGGRRNAYLLGAMLGVAGGCLAAAGIMLELFAAFCLGTFASGAYAAFVQSYRFAAADGLEEPQRAKAISFVMVGGLLAAVIGPQIVIWTKGAVEGAPFAGSFLGQAALGLLALPVLLLLRRPPAERLGPRGEGRSLGAFLRMPRYILAVGAGVVSYGLMTFVMTAAPIAMVGHGHSVDHAALGIQWHVLAMFGPSFFTGQLIARFGKETITAAGLLLIAGSAVLALTGLGLHTFWGSLVLLGLGWNFGFIGATAMITDCHSPAERGVAQGANDFIVFGLVAAASFFSGSLLHSSGWSMVNWVVFPAVALVVVPLLWRIGSAGSAPTLAGRTKP